VASRIIASCPFSVSFHHLFGTPEPAHPTVLSSTVHKRLLNSFGTIAPMAVLLYCIATVVWPWEHLPSKPHSPGAPQPPRTQPLPAGLGSQRALTSPCGFGFAGGLGGGSHDVEPDPFKAGLR
jgi:hypothetical protein